MSGYKDDLLETSWDGYIDKDILIMAFIKYFPEEDIRKMMEANELMTKSELLGKLEENE